MSIKIKKSFRAEFLPDENLTVDTVQSICSAAGLTVRPGNFFSGPVKFYDTFDWRLYSQNYELARIDSHYRLRRRDTGEVAADFPWRRQTRLTFARDLCQPELQQQLSDLIANRALLEQATAHLEMQQLEIAVPGGGRTPARLELTLQTVSAKRRSGVPPFFRIVRLEQRDGGRREFARVVAILQNCCGEPLATPLSPLAATAEAMGLTPGFYSTRITTPLQPEMSARTAAIQLSRDIVKVMRQNEPGLLADTDTEFLHDYRVSVRRLRSLLTQLREIFPEKPLTFFRGEFAVVGQLTNHLRDCDVLLENRTGYENMLPPSLNRGLVPFFNNIAAVRRKEHRRLVEYLHSAHYQTVCQEWDKFLDRLPNFPVTPTSEMSVGELSGKLILKRFRRVLRRGAAITAMSSDAEMHQLRIACKKLRYLLEFFAPLHADQLAEMIEQLKKMQSNLGDFNDLAVQIAKLDVRIRRASPHRRNSLLTAAAVGGLIAMLAEQKYRLRSEFDGVFAAFSSRANLRRYEERFGGEPAETN